MISQIWDTITSFVTQDWFMPLTVVVGALWAVILQGINGKNNRQNNELLNQPKFEFYDSMKCHSQIKNSCDQLHGDCEPSPGFCCNKNQCKDLHWFDIKNVGNFPAEDLSITLLLKDEEVDIEKEWRKHTRTTSHLQANESFQFKLPTDVIPFKDNYNDADDHHYEFIILVTYYSGYSRYEYRRVYTLDAANSSWTMKRPKSWNDAIYFYSVTEHDAKCKKDISLLRKISAKINFNYTYDYIMANWANNFWEKKDEHD